MDVSVSPRHYADHRRMPNQRRCILPQRTTPPSTRLDGVSSVEIRSFQSERRETTTGEDNTRANQGREDQHKIDKKAGTRAIHIFC